MSEIRRSSSPSILVEDEVRMEDRGKGRRSECIALESAVAETERCDADGVERGEIVEKGGDVEEDEIFVLLNLRVREHLDGMSKRMERVKMAFQ